MKIKSTVLAVVVALLLVGATALSAAGAANPAPGASTGGRYVLKSVSTAPSQALAGGRYSLAPAQPAAGEGCCCKTFLPCVKKLAH